MSEPLVLEAPPVLLFRSNPYGLAFSPDGRHLAIGTGGWFGGGGISLFDLASGRERTIRFVPQEYAHGVDRARGRYQNRALTASSLVFDESGDYLAATTWGHAHYEGPAFVYKIKDGNFGQVETRALPEYTDDPIFRSPTGLSIEDGALLVRSNAPSIEDTFIRVEMRSLKGVRGGTESYAHTRLARFGKEVISGAGHRLKHQGKAFGGLVVSSPTRVVHAPSGRITAVLARNDGSLVTGGSDGSLHRWQRADEWSPDSCLRPAYRHTRAAEGKWVTYRPESIVGLCEPGPSHLFSVDAAGELLMWTGTKSKSLGPLPRPGSPRCAAIHPQTPKGPMLAGGVKVPTGPGYVACYDLNALV